MRNGRILIVDDEDKLRQLFKRIIQYEGFDVIEAQDCKSAFRHLEHHHIDVVICDVKLPDGNGVELTAQIKMRYPFIEVVLLTAFGTIHDGVQAIKNGAFDYLVKGDDNDRLIPLIHRAIEKVDLQRRIKELEQRVGEKYSFDSVIGKSPLIIEAIELAKKVAPTEATVLLIGETGTGKEVFAQAIHQGGLKKGNPFLAINCSSFSKELLESELFGYVAGAFTGAIKEKKGLLEQVNGGSLFLDEIGEMPLDLQAKLLRVLETSEFIKVGGTTPIKVKFRLIAATNKDLKTESEANRFRSDLYFRLNVFQIKLPALRERKKDIELFVNFFIRQFSIKMNKKVTGYTPEFLSKLLAYNWPGNIRELRNCVERNVILANGTLLLPTEVPFDIQHFEISTDSTSSSLAMTLVEKHHIQRVLQITKGNKAEAARLLQIGIATLYRKMDEYKIQ